jgi:uncharacterized protein (TIGR02466 family)
MFEVHPLFFTPVYQTVIPEGLPRLGELKNYEFFDTGAKNSKNSFMTRNTSVLNDFPEEKQFILDRFYDIKNQFLRHEDTDFAITRSWATRAEKHSFSHFHRHCNNYFSGVFYFDDYEEGAGPIEFFSPLETHNFFSLKKTDYNLHNSLTWYINVGKNTMIFFPAYLKHRIGLHTSDKPRYSLAFNIHPIGECGIGDSQITINSIK